MKRGRLRIVGRWGVWFVTALVLVSIPVSVWVEPEVFIWYEQSDAMQTTKPWSVHLVDGRVVWYSEIDVALAMPETITHAPPWSAPDPNPGWRVRFRTGVDGFGDWSSNGSWWLPQFYDDRPFAYRFDLPLIYPAFLMMAWSGLLILKPARRRRLRLGRCTGCGYSLAGLSVGVCPECGAGTTT